MNEAAKGRDWRWVRWAGWSVAVALIAAPLVAMKAAPESGVNWTASDFLVAAAMLGVVGLVLELALRNSQGWAYRLAALLGVGTGFLLIWSNLAVGYIGDGSAPINQLLLAIPIVALIAAAAVRGRPRPMAWIMAATGAAHGVAGAIGYAQDTRTGVITAGFVGLWLISAALFRKAG